MKNVIVLLLATFLLTGCKKNLCENKSCLNGSSCDSGNGTCICEPGYEGENCGTEMREKFVGVYSGQLNIDGSNTVYVMSVEKGSTIKKIVLTIDGFPIVGELNETDHFYIQDQTIYQGGTGSRFIGSGSIDGTSLSVNFILSEPDGSYPSNCSFSGNR